MKTMLSPAPIMGTIFIFIGPKGSGKSFLGSLFQQHCGIPFLRVEDHIKRQNIKKDRAVNDQSYVQEVFQFIEELIRKELEQSASSQLAFESTGLTECFDAMLESLRRDYRVVTIGVGADPAACLQRVKSRDTALHIDISDEHVQMINEKVAEKGMACDYRIDNGPGGKSEMELINELKNILVKTMSIQDKKEQE